MFRHDELRVLRDIEFEGDFDSFNKKISQNEQKTKLDKTAIAKRFDEIINYEDIRLNLSQGCYKINVSGVVFDCFLNLTQSDQMYVFLNGAGITGRVETSHRWSWGRGCCSISISDPVCSKDVILGWYIGTKENDYRELISRLIQHISNLMGIDNSRIMIYGSSGGGTAALYVSKYVPHSISISINPQINIHRLNDHCKRLEDKLGFSIDQEMPERNDVFSCVNDSSSQHLILVNSESKNDIVEISNLFSKYGRIIKYGYTNVDNLHLWIYKAQQTISEGRREWSGHSSMDYNVLFPFIVEFSNKIIDHCIIEDIEEYCIMVNRWWYSHSKLIHEKQLRECIDKAAEGDPESAYLVARDYLENANNLNDAIGYLIQSSTNGYSKATKLLCEELYQRPPEVRDQIMQHIETKHKDYWRFLLAKQCIENEPSQPDYVKAAEYMSQIQSLSVSMKIEYYDIMEKAGTAEYGSKMFEIINSIPIRERNNKVIQRLAYCYIHEIGCAKDYRIAEQLANSIIDTDKGRMLLFDIYWREKKDDQLFDLIAPYLDSPVKGYATRYERMKKYNRGLNKCDMPPTVLENERK